MISTHILDTTKGLPAQDVFISLEIKDGPHWTPLASGQTNVDGRLAFDCSKKEGLYRLNFGIEKYFLTNGTEHFFMDTQIVFKITNLDRKYHVPMLLNPYGYSTYRGS